MTGRLPQEPRPLRNRGGNRGRRDQILIALAVAGLMLFNFPLLLIWDQGGTLFGLPGLPVVLFLIWGGLIALLAWFSEGEPDRPERFDEPDYADQTGTDIRDGGDGR